MVSIVSRAVSSRRNSGFSVGIAGIAIVLFALAITASAALGETGAMGIGINILAGPLFTGQIAQLQFNVTNTGDVNLTNITVEDRFNQGVFSFSSSDAIVGSNSSGIVQLTKAGGSDTKHIMPGQSIIILANFSTSSNDSSATHAINASGLGINSTTFLPTIISLGPTTSFPTPVFGDEYEPDNTRSTAKAITIDGTPQTHTFSPAGDTDWISFNARQGSIYDISVRSITPVFNASGSMTDSYLEVYDSRGLLSAANDNNYPGGSQSNYNPHIIWIAPTNGTSYLRVYEITGNSAGPGGVYAVSIREKGRLSQAIITTSKTAVLSNDVFNITTTFRCKGGPCDQTILTLDPQDQSSPGLHAFWPFGTKQTEVWQEPPKATKISNFPSIEEEIANDGSAPIIIQTRNPNTQPGLTKSSSEGGLAKSVSEGSSLMSAMAKTQTVQDGVKNSVQSKVGQDGFQVEKTMAALNMMSAKVNQEGLEALKSNPDVVQVYPDLLVQASLSSSAARIRADMARTSVYNNQTINGNGVSVCVLDSGVAYSHADFGSCNLAQVQAGTCPGVIGGYDYANNDNDPMDDFGHGSNVAGIIASRDATYKGIAPASRIAAVKVLGSDGTGLTSTILNGINWCVVNSAQYNISIISLSIGIEGFTTPAACDHASPYTPFIQTAIDNGILPIIASGNDYAGGSNPQAGVSSPACSQNATTVGATRTSDDKITSYSDRGPNLDILAPGEVITATDYSSSSGHVGYNGTSMATPHVSATAALIIQKFRAAYSRTPSPLEIRQILKATGAPIVDVSGTNLTFSRVDAMSAVLAKGVVPMTPGAKPFWTPSINPFPCGDIPEGGNCTASWIVNSSDVSGVYEFFAIASQDYDINYSSRFNVTARNVPPMYTIQTIISPQKGNMSTGYLVNITLNNSGSTTISQISTGVSVNYSDFIIDSVNPAPTTLVNGSISYINLPSSLAPGASYIITLGLTSRNRTMSGNSTITIDSNATDGQFPASASSSATGEIMRYNIAPRFVSTPVLLASVGLNYTYNSLAVDDNGDALTYGLPQSVGTMGIEPLTGIVRFTPSLADIGRWNITVNVTDGLNTTNQMYTLNVTGPNLGPSITSTPVTTATEDLAYIYNVVGVDPENGPLFFSLDKSPSGMTINNLTGRIAWIALNNNVGMNTVTVNVSDNVGNMANQSFTITVLNNPVMITALTGPANITASLVGVFDANSTDDGQNVTYSLGGALAGMSIDPENGTVTWIPSANLAREAPYQFTVIVDDGNAGVDRKTVNVTVLNQLYQKFLGPSTVNMSSQANYSIYFENRGNSTIGNLTIMVGYPSDNMTFSSAGLLKVNGTALTAVLNADVMGDGTPFVWNQTTYPLHPRTNGSVVVSFTAKNLTSDSNNTIWGGTSGKSEGYSVEAATLLNLTILFVNYIPYFTSQAPNSTLVTMSAFTYDADAADGNGDPILYGLMRSPNGTTIDNATGIISWTPTLFQNGTFNFTINASDGRGGVGFQSFLLYVVRLNRAPDMKSVANQVATEDNAFDFNASTTDPENDTLSYALDIAPAGMTLSSSLGILNWTASNTQVGNWTVRVNASDPYRNLTQITFNITVLNNPPNITTNSPGSVVQGMAYVYDADSSDDGQGNMTWGLVSGPTGMLINTSTGIVTWIPSVDQVANGVLANIDVDDGHSGIGTQTLIINVTPAMESKLSAVPNPISMGQQVKVVFNATDVGNRSLENLTLAMTFSPEDLILLNSTPNSTGVDGGNITFGNISPILNDKGSAIVTTYFITKNSSISRNTTLTAAFNISDNGSTIKQNTGLRLEISFSNFAPQILTVAPTTAIFNTTYTYDVDAVDGNGDTVTFNLSSGPGGMKINSSTGVLTWLANETGNKSVSIQALDLRGGVASQNFVVEVRTINKAPNITSTPVLSVVEDSQYSYDVDATDPDSDVVTYTLVSGPSGMTINTQSGVISFLPLNNQVGTVPVTVRASDHLGGYNDQGFTLLIINNPPIFSNSGSAPLSVNERGNWSYTFTSSDDVPGITSWSLDAAPTGMTIVAANGSVKWTPLTSQVGPNNVSVRVSDGNGGTAQYNFTINVADLTPPSVVINSPANATLFNVSSINVTFTGSDNGGLANCWVAVNSTPYSGFQTTSSYNKTQSGRSEVRLLEGNNNLTAYCVDSSGLSNTSAGVTVFTDSIAPVIVISSPFNGYNSSANLTLTYSVSDATLNKVWMVIGGSVTSLNASGTYIIQPNEGNGQILTIFANDSVGSISNASVLFNVDKTSPVPILGMAGAAPIAPGRSATVLATSIGSSDNLGIATRVFDIDSSDGIGNVDSTAENVTIGFSRPGTYVVTLSVIDVAGNTGRTNASVTLVRDSDGDNLTDDNVAGLVQDTCPYKFNPDNNASLCANDADSDGINDSVDTITGTAGNVYGGVANLTMTVDLTVNPISYAGFANISFNDTNGPLFWFYYNLTPGTPLMMGQITIQRQVAGILISGLPSGLNKTVALPKDVWYHNSVCVKDSIVSGFGDMTANCTGAGEIQVNCTGTAQGKTCTDTGKGFHVTNLANTLVKSYSNTGNPPNTVVSNVTITNTPGGDIIIVQHEGGGGGSFTVERGSKSGTSTSASYIPPSLTPMPTTIAASPTPKVVPKTQEPETELVVVRTPVESTPEPVKEANPNDQTYLVRTSAASSGEISGGLITVAILIVIAVMLGIVALLLWAMRR